MRLASKRRTVMIALASIMGVAAGVRAEAAFTLTFNQVGSDVVATGSGSLILVGGPISPVAQKGIQPAKAVVLAGPLSAYPSVYLVSFLTAEGFGTGQDSRLASSGTGDPLGLSATLGQLYAPATYVSGSQLSTSSTFTGSTLAGLGLTLGTYNYSYSATPGGAVLDTFTIQVGPAAIPEPSSLALCGSAAVVSLVVARVRRRRVVD